MTRVGLGRTKMQSLGRQPTARLSVQIPEIPTDPPTDTHQTLIRTRLNFYLIENLEPRKDL
jgi:hypothetical protein